MSQTKIPYCNIAHAWIGHLRATDYCKQMVIVLSSRDKLLIQVHEYASAHHFLIFNSWLPILASRNLCDTRIEFQLGSSWDCQRTFEQYSNNANTTYCTTLILLLLLCENFTIKLISYVVKNFPQWKQYPLPCLLFTHFLLHLSLTCFCLLLACFLHTYFLLTCSCFLFVAHFFVIHFFGMDWKGYWTS